MNSKRFFYGKAITRKVQQEHIDTILNPFKKQPATEELRRKIVDLLVKEKFEGRVQMPFQVVLRKDPTDRGHDYIDVVLESKV